MSAAYASKLLIHIGNDYNAKSMLIYANNVLTMLHKHANNMLIQTIMMLTMFLNTPLHFKCRN